MLRGDAPAKSESEEDVDGDVVVIWHPASASRICVC